MNEKCERKEFPLVFVALISFIAGFERCLLTQTHKLYKITSKSMNPNFAPLCDNSIDSLSRGLTTKLRGMLMTSSVAAQILK